MSVWLAHGSNKAWSVASEFQNNRLIEPYQSELIRLYILKIKIDVENSELTPICRLGELEISSITVY